MKMELKQKVFGTTPFFKGVISNLNGGKIHA